MRYQHQCRPDALARRSSARYAPITQDARWRSGPRHGPSAGRCSTPFKPVVPAMAGNNSTPRQTGKPPMVCRAAARLHRPGPGTCLAQRSWRPDPRGRAPQHRVLPVPAGVDGRHAAASHTRATQAAPQGNRPYRTGSLLSSKPQPTRRTVAPPALPFVLHAGAVISAALIAGIRSDLPGQK